MKTRINRIYNELYMTPKSKDELMLLLDVSQKTIENTIIEANKAQEDIVYDRKLGKYRFNTLLPTNIPSYIIFKYLHSSVTDELLKDDYAVASETIKLCNIDMIATSTLSPLLKSIIMINIAFVINASLKIEYIGNNQKLETKFVKPHTLINNHGTYHLSASYSNKNSANVGEYRTFSLRGIKSIEIDEILSETLYQEAQGNAWGIYKKDSFIVLKLKDNAVGYFKKENLINKNGFEFVSEEADGSLLLKKYYNNIQEIILLLQQWMPYITILKESDIANEIYNEIKSNFVNLTINKEMGR